MILKDMYWNRIEKWYIMLYLGKMLILYKLDNIVFVSKIVIDNFVLRKIVFIDMEIKKGIIN